MSFYCQCINDISNKHGMYLPNPSMRAGCLFVLQHINLIGHLMPNRVKENKSEKKFKGEILGINDRL